MVSTPQGLKSHGYIDEDVFIRYVKDSDLMRIFDAWSIHPEALKAISDKVKTLRYIHNDGTIYEMDLITALQKGFEKEFAGGKTIYLQRKHWTIKNEKNISEKDREAGQNQPISQ